MPATAETHFVVGFVAAPDHAAGIVDRDNVSALVASIDFDSTTLAIGIEEDGVVAFISCINGHRH